jgi:integrase
VLAVLGSLRLDSNPPTVTVEAATSKHRKKDVLPLYPELVAVLRDWLHGLKPSEKLFPMLERRKAWLMVKRDLERVGIPYETDDGIADFHAAGRHTHITELLRNGASLPEAQKLARHSDIKLTMRYVHIEIDDQAKAVANLPATALHRRCISGVSDRHSVSAAGSAPTKKESLTSRNSKRLGTVCHCLALGDKMEARGRQ